MYRSIAFALVSSASFAAAHPFHLSPREVTQFPAGSSWDILLSKGDSIGNVKQVVNEDFEVIDIDLFDTDAETISALKASNKQVICYFSAGSQEGWRPDSAEFKDGDVGQGLDGWPDEKWVNVKSENVRNIMKKRIQKAAENGCTAVDPDNVDGFDGGQDGFGYDRSAYIDYVRFMAQEAKNSNLAIGLKNAVSLIPDVVDVMQFAVNEQCHEFSECALYKPFTDANKAVFNIEYGGKKCESPSGVTLSTVIKPEDQGLSTLGGACEGQQPADPVPSQTAPSEPAPTQPAPSQPAASQPAPSQPASSQPATSQPVPSRPTPTPTKPSAPTPTQGSAQPTPTDSDEDDDDDDEGEDEPTPTPSSRPWWGNNPWRYHWGWGNNHWGH